MLLQRWRRAVVTVLCTVTVLVLYYMRSTLLGHKRLHSRCPQAPRAAHRLGKIFTSKIYSSPSYCALYSTYPTGG